MPGDREDFDIARVAALARLHLSPSEESLFGKQLREILAFVAELRDVEAADVETEARAVQVPASGRPDEVAPSLAVDAALGNAPDATLSPRLVRVPKVIG